MSEHTHHDDHGHGHETSKPHAGYFEIPIVLGGLFWGLILTIVTIVNCNNCCEEDGACCKEGGSCEKTEMPAGGGEHH